MIIYVKCVVCPRVFEFVVARKIVLLYASPKPFGSGMALRLPDNCCVKFFFVLC